MKLLFFIPSLDYSGAAKQLLLLATGLPREQCALRVCALGRPAPWADALRAAGVEVDLFPCHRLFDIQPWLSLRRAIRAFRPDVVHAWGLSMIWPGLQLRHWSGGRLIVSAFRPTRDWSARLGWLDRWMLRPSCPVVAGSPAEVERCRKLGLPAEKLVPIPPGVALPAPASESSEVVRRRLGLPANLRLLVGIGPVERARGFHDAVWAFDILKYLYPELRLVLVGHGSDRPRLEQFARALGVTREVHFVGLQPDVGPILHDAEIVWVPGRSGGVNAALEAMAAGRPVVAARLPALADVVADGQTGTLHAPGDKAALARQTRVLLDDAEQRRRLGEAGRKRVEASFTVAEMVRRYRQLYETI